MNEAMDKFEKGDCVDRLIHDMLDRWSEGWTVIEMPDDFVPLGDCVYVEKNGQTVGVPPPHLRHTLANNPKTD